MRNCALLLLAVGISLSEAKAAPPRLLGAWEYSSPHFWLAVHLWENGNCLVSTQRSRDPSITYLECSFTTRGDVVLLERREAMSAGASLPARLYYDPVSDFFVAEGEPDRFLMRKKN
jgi:hypothetical protein